MAPQWMPQNLQKRLLLYILQQLSLFSEIDLPNLDVSLGSSSKVTLKDVNLDPDALQIPGAFLRDGKVRNLELQLNMSGGVSIEADGLELTMALASPNSLNANNGATEKSKFSLSQSTMGLAASVMGVERDEDDDGDDDEAGFQSTVGFQTPSQSYHENADVSVGSSQNIENTSTINNVMTRAVEAALSRLQVSLKDISVRLIMDQATLDLTIKQASFVTNNGERNIELSDITILTVKPNCDPGEEPDIDIAMEGENAQSISTLKGENKDEMDDYHEDDVSDSDSDDDHDEMMSSSILQKPSDMNTSLVYSKEEASSIYMSAASNIFQPQHSDEKASRLMFINKAEVSFNGLSNIENIQVTVDQLKIAATPLPTTLLYVLESLSILNIHDTVKRNSLTNLKGNLRRPANAQTPKDDTSQLFEAASVNHIEVGLVSALRANGDFANPLGLRLIGKGFHTKQGDLKLTYGGLESLVMLNNKADVVLKFEGDPSKNDLRFESKSSTGELTILLSKNLDVNIDQNIIQGFIYLTSLLPQVMSSLKKLGSSSTKKPSKGSLVFQNSTTTININLGGDQVFNLNISPISYDSTKSLLSIKKIAVSRNKTSLLLLSNIQLESLATEKQIKSYDNSGHEIVLTCPQFITIDKVDLEPQFCDFKSSLNSLLDMVNNLIFPVEEIRFKGRKKAKISTNLIFQSKQSVKAQVIIKELTCNLHDLYPGFGDISGSLKQITVSLFKDDQIQLHSSSLEFYRFDRLERESVISPINLHDRSAPILSVRIRKNKNIHGFLRNTAIEYYTSWISIFNNPANQKESDSPGVSTPDKAVSPIDEGNNIGLNITLVECAIGLNPGRLPSKAYLSMKNGNVDLKFQNRISVKSQIRSAALLLIDDTDNILTPEEAKRYDSARNSRKPTWSNMSTLNTRGFTNVANINALHIDTEVKSSHGSSKGKVIDMDVSSDSLDIELCADSSQCLTQLLNDLKQPVSINNDLKYKFQTPQPLDIFNDVDENAFKATLDDLILPQQGPSSAAPEPLNIVDSYYDDSNTDKEDVQSWTGSDILDKNLAELAITNKTLSKNPFFGVDNDTAPDSAATSTGSPANTEPVSDKSEKSDSIIMFNDGHFEDKSGNSLKDISEVIENPMTITISVASVSLKIHDGYDWKHTRKTISNTVKKLEKRAAQEKERRELSDRRRNSNSSRPNSSGNNNDEEEDDDENIVGETLFDSIHVAFPIGSDPSKMTTKINNDLQSKESEDKTDDNNGIEVGKNNFKKLKLRRSKYHKILIEIHQLEAKIKIITNSEPVTSSTIKDEFDYELLNDIDVQVADFEIIDNVPTSTWNKFVTEMKDIEREVDASMLSMNIKTIRPVMSLAATELLINVHVQPLRLHVDQDTLEILTRFGEFKDSRFNLVDEFEDIVYIQKFQINSVHIKLDYKPKKIDYAGLRSGHTTEFMNFFILDEADMVLKNITLYGVSGFPRLGKLLNGLWMPDIRSTQLSGVLSGLASVRSIVSIGNEFKGLVVVPMKEYKKDGRIYRSVSKGVQQFTKNTTNELLKFGVKIAAGTQTLLEHTEEALGGNGAQSRIPQQSPSSSRRRAGAGGGRRTNETIYEEDEEDEDPFGSNEEDDEDSPRSNRKNNGVYGSQLIGRGSSNNTMNQSILESFIDLNRDSGIRRDPTRNPRDLLYVASSHNKDQFELLDSGDGDEDESQKTISLYADQPSNLKEGFKLAYDSFGRNLLVAKDAIWKAGSEIGDSGSAHDTTVAVVKATPVALIRPMIGATEAVSKALLGVTNQLDPGQKKYIEDKYKHFKR